MKTETTKRERKRKTSDAQPDCPPPTDGCSTCSQAPISTSQPAPTR